MIFGYVFCGFFEEVRKLFDEMFKRDFFIWNMMISGYVKN